MGFFAETELIAEVGVFPEVEVVGEVEVVAVPTAEQGVEERMGPRGVMRKGVSVPSAALRNATSLP